jgi:hypothetical protein
MGAMTDDMVKRREPDPSQADRMQFRLGINLLDRAADGRRLHCRPV